MNKLRFKPVYRSFSSGYGLAKEDIIDYDDFEGSIYDICDTITNVIGCCSDEYYGVTLEVAVD